MQLIPNETRDFEYAIPFFRVARGGSLKVKLVDGTVESISVRSGEYVKLSVLRIYQIGTTAGGFQTQPTAPAVSADRFAPCPYIEDDELFAALLADSGLVLLTDDGIPLLF